MTKILLAVDLNHEASWKAALPEAVAQATLKSAELHLLAILPDFGYAMVQTYFPPDFEREALEKTLNDLKALGEAEIGTAVPWHAHVGHGDIDVEILRVAEEMEVAMIVMASHPVSELRTFLIGSHADKIVHRAPMSVLVVR
ncbi:MAG: universal stress protein [Pseudomonadota bacterium]